MNNEKTVLCFVSEDGDESLKLSFESNFVPRVGDTLDLSSEGFSKEEEVSGVHYVIVKSQIEMVHIRLKGR